MKTVADESILFIIPMQITIPRSVYCIPYNYIVGGLINQLHCT